MSNLEEKVTDIWEEVILKEKLNTIITSMKNIEERLTGIEERLTIIETQPLFEKDKSLEPIVENPEIKEINTLERAKEPIMKNISKIKPKMNEEVKTIIDRLAESHKRGRI